MKWRKRLKNGQKEPKVDMRSLRWSCAGHLDKYRATLVKEWTKILRDQLDIPSSSSFPDPATMAFRYKELDSIFKKFAASVRDNDFSNIAPAFAANHHEVLDHAKSLAPLLLKLTTFSDIVRRSIITDPTIPSVPALYLFDHIFNKIQSESVLLFGERRRAALRRLVERYKEDKELAQAVVDSSPVGILVTDRSGHIVHFNRQQEIISGRSGQSVLGKRLYHDYAIHYEAEFKRAFERAIQYGETAHFKEREYTATGAKKMILNIWLGPVQDKHGRITGAIQILQDVTDKALRDQKREKQKQEMSARLNELEEAYTYIGKINRQFSSLVDINNTLSSKISLDKMLDFIVRSAAMLTKARLTTLRTLKKDELELVAQYGFTAEQAERTKFAPVERSVIGTVLKEKRQMLIVDLDQDAKFFFKNLKETLGLKQLVSVPLRSRGKIIGVLSIHLPEQREFSNHEQNFLIALANQAALAIDLEKALAGTRSQNTPPAAQPKVKNLTISSNQASHGPIRYTSAQKN